MVRSGRKGGVAFWAWMISVVVHVIALFCFGAFRLSRAGDFSGPGQVPAVSVVRSAAPVAGAAIAAKPGIRRVSSGTAAVGSWRPASPGVGADLFSGAEYSGGEDLGDLLESYDSGGGFSAWSDYDFSGGVEFFGRSGGHRKVCYVVDCSGSMLGVFGRVREELCSSIRALDAGQYFQVILFGGGRLFESDSGGLVRATAESKSAVLELIASVRPGGRTNAIAALERASEIRDSQGASPSVVYFLTDGFDLTGGDDVAFSGRLENLVGRFGAGTRINTIGFWPEEGDRRILEALARRSGGRFVLIGGNGGKGATGR